MPIKTSITTTGGAKLRKVLAQAEANRDGRVVVGFLAGTKTDDGTPMATIAAALDYGGGDLPERPFFRQSIYEIRRELPGELRRVINPETMTVSRITAARVGAFAQDIIEDRILALSTPPNAPATLAQKQGSNPLVNERELLGSIGYDIDRQG